MKKYKPVYIAIVFCIITSILASIEFDIKLTWAWLCSCYLCFFTYLVCEGTF